MKLGRLMFGAPMVLFAIATMAFAADEPSPMDPTQADWSRNLRLFAGLDGSKQPQDLGINANMGGRLSIDIGLPAVQAMGLGMHLGAAVNASDAAVHVLDQIEGTSRRTQYYVTAGLFQRSASRFTWALGTDFQDSRYYDDFWLGEVRGLLGYDATPTNQIGLWFAQPLFGDEGTMGGVPVQLDPIAQANLYLSHTWPSRSRTTVWAGLARGHDNVVFVFPHDSRNENVFVYGAQLHMPLSDRFAMTGAANFLTPTSTGTVDAFLGLAWYPGGRLMSQALDRYEPVLDVGNNPTFAVDLRR